MRLLMCLLYMGINRNVLFLATAMTLSGLSQAQEYVEYKKQEVLLIFTSSNLGPDTLGQKIILKLQDGIENNQIMERYAWKTDEWNNHYKEIISKCKDPTRKEEIDQIYRNIYVEGQEYMDIYYYEWVIDSKTLQEHIEKLCKKEEKIYKTATKDMKKQKSK